MAKVIKFPVSAPEKLGLKKARKRKKPDPEDLGQLNLFNQIVAEPRVRRLNEGGGFFEQALELDEQGDASAEQLYLKAIEAGESVANAYCNLGILMNAREEHAKAVDYLTRCLQENPRHYEAHYNLGNLYSELGNFSLSKMHYEVSTELEPTFPNGYYNLGLVLISMHEYDQASKAILRYIALSPESDHTVAHDLLKTLKTLGA